MSSIARFALCLVCVGLVACGGKEDPADDRPTTPGQSPEDAEVSAAWRTEAEEALERGAAYLESKAQDGKWKFMAEAENVDPGASAFAAWALLEARGDAALETVRPTLDWLVSLQKAEGADRGAIYDDKLATYVTSVAMQALIQSGDSRYEPVVERARGFLKRVQLDESDDLETSSEDYGGIGYGGSGVTNMSTTQFAIDAVSEAGLPKDDAFYSKALRFLQRSQNRSESNDAPADLRVDGKKVVPGNDGGGYYRPGESKAGHAERESGGVSLRSYGSMTYALLKSYLLSGLEADDPRVQAALGWMAENFELDHNPGMEHAPGDDPNSRYMGLFYYYLAVARTLSVAERDGVALPSELENWRAELASALVSRQKEGGFWTNEQDRWREGFPNLATSYAVIALADLLEGADG